MSKRPAFITVPTPHTAVRNGVVKHAGRKERFASNIRAYLRQDEYDAITRAAILCNCTRSEFLRQLGLNAAVILGVRSDGSG